ncbi:MAG: hypothetical protein FVQ85_04505 [Planctomycetes bacterium]|nr:hypothetical protein [Planctomycetota bacterium]
MDNNKTIATNVDSFEPSLWNYIGQYKSKYALISMVDQIHNDRIEKRNPEYPVVLLSGCQGGGRRTLARALHSSIGNLEFREAALILGTSEDHTPFFQTATEYTTLYIPNFDKISSIVAGALVHIIRDKCLHKTFPSQEAEIIPYKNRLIILSTDPNPIVHPDVLKYVGIRCELGGYSLEHIRMIIRQRIAYLGWDASQETVKLISENSENNPGKAVKLLQQTYVIARSEDRDINITHAKKALVLIS